MRNNTEMLSLPVVFQPMWFFTYKDKIMCGGWNVYSIAILILRFQLAFAFALFDIIFCDQLLVVEHSFKF